MANVALLSIGLILLLAFLSAASGSIFSDTFRSLQEARLLSLVRDDSFDDVKTFWVDQKVDHFNTTETRTWLMRYQVNKRYFRTGGPMFIILIGAAQIESSIITAGHAYDMAKKHNAVLILPEHRYYGHSKVSDDLSTEKLRYLSAKQALADLAHLIRDIKRKTVELINARVILVGYGYGGSLAVWFKQIYAKQAAGVWASSAARLAQLNMPDFMQSIGQSIQLVGGRNCYKRIENAIAKMEEMFATARGAELMELLKLCENFNVNNLLNVRHLFAEIANLFAEMVQSSQIDQIEKFCGKIMTAKDDLIAISRMILSGFSAKYKDAKCNDLTYTFYIKSAAFRRYGKKPTRQWLFQACNEFGWFQTSDSKVQPFGTYFPLDYFTQICAKVFGAKYTKEFIQAQIKQTNAYFGGLQPAVEDVYYSQGQLDAWHAVDKQNDTEAFILTGYAHCMDLRSISNKDTLRMHESKQIVAKLVQEWLK